MKITIVKYIVSVMMLLIATVSVNAQKFDKIVSTLKSLPHDVRTFTVIDTTKLLIQYSVKAIINPVTYPTDTLNEVLTLKIGNKLSKSYNQTTFDADSILFYNYIAKGEDGPYRTESLVPVDVFKNYPSGITTVEYRLTKYNYRYTEKYPLEFNWNLENEHKSILSYRCQKATCTFRGRTYTAWFTPDIPISNGPYKFGGLPGLILQIHDDKNHYIFTCIGIQKPKSVIPIKLFKWKYTTISREKLNKSLINIYNNQAQFMISSGRKGLVRGNDGKLKDVTAQLPNSCSYNPIELE